MGSGGSRLFSDAVVRWLRHRGSQVAASLWHGLAVSPFFEAAWCRCAPVRALRAIGDLSCPPGIFLGGARAGLHVPLYSTAYFLLAQSRGNSRLDAALAVSVSFMGEPAWRLRSGNRADRALLCRRMAARPRRSTMARRARRHVSGNVPDPLRALVFFVLASCPADGASLCPRMGVDLAPWAAMDGLLLHRHRSRSLRDRCNRNSKRPWTRPARSHGCGGGFAPQAVAA